MPPTKKAAAKRPAAKQTTAAPPVHSDVTAPTPQDVPPASADVTTAPAPDVTPADDYGYQEPETPKADNSGLVRYQLEDGSTAHGVVIGQVDGDTDREDAVQLVPLPEAITIPVSQLVTDDDDTQD